MRCARLFKRFAMVVVSWPLLFSVALGDGTRDAGKFELKGVLISPTSRSALINGQVSCEGEFVGRAEILRIEEKGVRLRMGSEEYTVLVGSSAIVHRRAAVQAAPSAYQVKRGDTLSTIAESFVGDGITMNQMMVALFEANPHAFDGNINRINAGALLRIPDRQAVRSHAFETATAKVLHQMKSWRAEVKPRPTEVARVPEVLEYGPVSSGETLSRIAAKISRDGVTLNQMMIALFEANPQAFNGNINLLLKGALLRIPVADEMRRQAPETATAEVLRHTRLWRDGQKSTEPVTLMTALNHGELIR